MVSRQPTSPYPDNPRSEWAIKPLVLPTYGADGLLAFAYEVYPTQRSMDRGDLPFLVNSHKAMVRENHQRIRLDTNGHLMHRSGIAVPAGDVEEFLRTDPRAYRWTQPWRDDRGRELLPFIFLTYWGVPEALDPQWVRETFTVPRDQQVQALIAQYLTGVEPRRLSGDHRGTTLDLQVGAGADDALVTLSGASSAPHTWGSINLTHLNNAAGTAAGPWWYGSGVRFLNVTPANGDTIDVAYLTYTASNSLSGVTANSDIYGEDIANAATYGTVGDFNGRAKLAAVVWDSLPAWTAETAYNSPSLVVPTQAIADKAGRVANDAMAFKWEDGDSSGAAAYRLAYSYNNSTTKAPKLHIEYTAGGGGRIMGALAGHGGLAGPGGLAGRRGGLGG